MTDDQARRYTDEGHEEPMAVARRRADELEDLFGGLLESVVLFGSTARGEPEPAVSDLNLLVLLHDLRAVQLIKGASLARRWVEVGEPLPMLFTPSEWSRTADSFAIEVSDMLENRTILYGPDPVAGMEVDPADLRIQTERELRGKVIQLREGMLLSADQPPELGRLLLLSAPSIATYVRAIVRLEDGRAPEKTPAAVERVGEIVDCDPETFLWVWRQRRRPDRFQPSIESPETEAYFDFVVALADHADRYDE